MPNNTKYNVKYDNIKEDILTRILKIRGLDDDIDNFLDPKLSDYWTDPFLLNDMNVAVDRLLLAIKNNEKIMIFGDYDVDGVTSSYLLFTFIKNYLKHPFVSIQYPDRKKDWYGIKTYHVKEIKEKWVSLIITVDNWITSIEEAKYAKKEWVDLIITDHHHPLSEIPDAFAVVNPQVSPEYEFKGLAGVGVAFKLINAILTKTDFTKEKKNQIFEYYLPIVAIWTVADVVSLVKENRVIVKKWLEILNFQRHKSPASLQWFLKYLNIKKDVDTFHIGFVIWPRINAGGRICSPYDSLNTLLYSGEKQIEYLEKIDAINTERKKLQDTAFGKAKELINHEQNFLCAASDEFHEGIVGIVSWRITEQNNKPSMVLSINQNENKAVWSLRWPSYFNVIEMLKSAEHLLDRFGWHKQAWWLSVKLNNLADLQKFFEDYCNKKIKKTELKKIINIDTKLHKSEWKFTELSKLQRLAPFGEWNTEPIFLLEEIMIDNVEKIGKRWKWHAKIYWKFGDNKIVGMFWWKGEEIEELQKIRIANIVGKIKKDTYNGWYFIDCIDVFDI